jgi:phenylalanyl-tRNA synthetase alpha chain
MKEKIQELTQKIQDFEIIDAKSLENFRITFLKNEIPALMALMKSIPNEEKKEFGQLVNGLKNLAQEKFDACKEKLDNQPTQELPPFDLTLPIIPNSTGTLHPLTLIRQRIVDIFAKMGFSVADGAEIEDDWHNFSALNFPPNHPARDMQDTFFVDEDIVLRTHTSSVQVRLMENKKPPLRAIMPGRVFRNEAITARAHCIFHQVEGLYVDENVSLVDLKQTLYHFVKEMFGQDTQVRFRSSYFPFTEVSAEVDISCQMNNPQGCSICGGSKNVCKGTGWVEILGCGMVHPNVLENCGIDSEKYTGFAFGMGIERIAMLKYRVKDLRLFTENDIRFLRQFSETWG